MWKGGDKMLSGYGSIWGMKRPPKGGSLGFLGIALRENLGWFVIDVLHLFVVQLPSHLASILLKALRSESLIRILARSDKISRMKRGNQLSTIYIFTKRLFGENETSTANILRESVLLFTYSTSLPDMGNYPARQIFLATTVQYTGFI